VLDKELLAVILLLNAVVDVLVIDVLNVKTLVTNAVANGKNQLAETNAK